MYISINNGKAVIATHLIRAEINNKIREDLSFQAEPEGVVCYSAEELEKVKAMLDKVKVKYTVEEIPTPGEAKQKAKGIKYASCSEALKHLKENIEPESMFMPNLIKRLEKAEEDNKQLRQDVDTLKKVQP